MPEDKSTKTIVPKTWIICASTMKFFKTLTKPRQSESWFSWVIAFSCMMVISGTFGIFRSSGVFFAEVIHAYHVDRETASWPFAVSGILNSFSGIVCGPLTTVLPIRLIVILGICASAFGLGICSFTSSILWITVGYGLLFGLGTGMVYVCLPMVINDYFKKNKSTGNGILLAGTPLGVTVLAPISELLITTYALRGTFLFLSAVCLQTLVFAALMKPAKPPPLENYSVSNKDKRYVEATKESRTLNCESNTEEFSVLLNVKDHSIIPHSESENDLSDFQKPYPTEMKERYVLVKSSSESDRIDFDCIENLEPTDFEHATNSDYQKVQSSCRELDNLNTKILQPNCEYISSAVRMDNGIRADVVSDVNGPSEKNLWLKTSLSILTNQSFIIMTFNFMVLMAAVQTVTVVLVDYAEDKGLSRENAVLLFTAISVPEIFSRTCSGWITDKGFVRKDYFLVLSQIISGIVTILITFVYGKIALCVLLVLFGIFSSTVIVLVNVFCADNFQKDLLGFVFGIRHASMIIICLTRPWLIGIFRDNIGSYDYLFHVAGGTTALSAFLWLFTFCKK